MALRVSACDAGEIVWGGTQSDGHLAIFVDQNPRARESKVQDGLSIKRDLNNVSWKCLEGSGCVSTPVNVG